MLLTGVAAARRIEENEDRTIGVAKTRMFSRGLGKDGGMPIGERCD